MKFINILAQAVGYTVIVMWLLGVAAPVDFRISFTSQAEESGENIYSCDAGDSFWTRRKYLCNRAEWAAQREASTEPSSNP